MKRRRPSGFARRTARVSFTAALGAGVVSACLAPPGDDASAEGPLGTSQAAVLCTAGNCTSSTSCQKSTCSTCPLDLCDTYGCYDSNLPCTVGTCSIANCNTASFDGPVSYPWHANTFCRNENSQVVTCRAWYDSGAVDCQNACTATSSCASTNLCRNTNGQTISCSVWGTCDQGTCASLCGGFVVRNCSSACTAGGNLATTCGQMGYACVGGINEPPPPCSQCTTKSSCNQQCSNGASTSTCGVFTCAPSCASCTWSSAPDTLCQNGAAVSTCGVAGRSTKPVVATVALSSGSRRLVQGYDGGHNENFCSQKDTLSSNCPLGGSTFDGLQLIPDPNGAWAVGNSNLPTRDNVTVRAIEGPYQAFASPFKWEWREGTTNDWTYRAYDLVSVRFRDVSAATSYTGNITFYWDEDDGVGDDDFNWAAPMGQYLSGCLSNAAAPNTWSTYATGQFLSNVSGHYLCDSRGCGDGEYEVRYDVRCTWHY
jgi:hypothetical protein